MEEDKNTEFFHKMANAHKRRNFMTRVKVYGGWFIEEDEINVGGGGGGA